ncbi:MAG: DUF4157 domain-containing protein [Bacteroidia bacterium]|nr:DUF4157 domain-containing protein [Bacteroidia bacterium]
MGHLSPERSGKDALHSQTEAQPDAKPQGQTLTPPAFQLKTDNEPDREEKESEGKTVEKSPDFQFAADAPEPPPADNPVQRKEGEGSGGGNLSQGGPLPDPVQSKMEGALGADFSGVNIHENSNQASEMGALAYTQGNDVHFAPGQFKPDTQSGQELIGHELTHVVQQREGRVQPTGQLKGQSVNTDAGLEGEADTMGAKAAQMKVAPENESHAGTTNEGSGPVQAKMGPMQFDFGDPVYQIDGLEDYSSGSSGARSLASALQSGISENLAARPVAQRMVRVLPAAANILYMSLDGLRPDTVRNPANPFNPMYYAAQGIAGADLDILWKLYKARWESPNTRARTQNINQGRSALGPLMQRSTINTYISDPEQRAGLSTLLSQYILEPVDAVRADPFCLVLSNNGVPAVVDHDSDAYQGIRATDHSERAERDHSLDLDAYAQFLPAATGRALLNSLRTAIPAAEQDGLALQLILILPALAAILDGSLEPANWQTFINRESPHHPAGYENFTVAGPGNLALWDFYKARWESANRETRRPNLSLGNGHSGYFRNQSLINRFVPANQRNPVNALIRRLITQPIQNLTNRANYQVFSTNGVPMTMEEYQARLEAERLRREQEAARRASRGQWTEEQTGEAGSSDFDQATFDAMSTEERLAEITAARSEFNMVAIRTERIEFLNTDVLAPLTIKGGNDLTGPRHILFGNLIRLLNHKATLERRLEEARSPFGDDSAAADANAQVRSLQEELRTLQVEIDAAIVTASAAARTYYEGQLESLRTRLASGRRGRELGAAVAPSAPGEDQRQQRDSLSTDRHSPETVRWFIERALRAISEGHLTRRYERTEYRAEVAGRAVVLTPVGSPTGADGEYHLSRKVDLPSGYVAGGASYRPGLIQEVVADPETRLAPEWHSTAIHCCEAFQGLEGRPTSLNTWDSAGITLGSGIAARGRLQTYMYDFQQSNPGAFHRLFGRYGINTYRRGGVTGLSLMVPEGGEAGGPAAGTVLNGEAAIQYIINDPLLLAQCVRAGHSIAWQRALIQAAIHSLKSALAFTYGGKTWPQIITGVPEPLREASLFAITNQFHGAGNASVVTSGLNDSRARIQTEYHQDIQSLEVSDATLLTRREMARVAFLSVPGNRRAGFLRIVPATESFLAGVLPTVSPEAAAGSDESSDD